MVWVAQESFANGEISPSVYGVVSSQQYQAGCQSLVNALLTPTGAAKKRHGTGQVATPTGGHPAALFSYFAKGKQFVVQFVSEDDDSGDLNTTARQVRVIDATTRQFINFADGNAHGPFNAFGDSSAYFHHFTRTQLRTVYAFQDDERIYFCHPDRPMIYLEREVGDGGTERWDYGLAPPVSTTPRIVDYQVPRALSQATATSIESDGPLFDKRDEGAYWRIGGAEPSNPAVNVYGSWFRTSQFRTSERMIGAEIYGQFGDDTADWTGPYKRTGTDWNVTLQSNSGPQNESVVVDWTASIDAKENWIGLPIEIANVLFLITDVTAAKQIIATRLGAGGTLNDAPQIHLLRQFAIGADPVTPPPTSEFLNQRPYLRRHPIMPSGTTGSIQLYSSQGFLPSDTAANLRWLPEGHENTFDSFGGTAVGGTVHLNGGIVALTSVSSTEGPEGTEFVYTGTVVKTLAHAGPSMQWGLGQSEAVGFPSCGAPHQSRVYLGGYKERPTRVVASRVFERDDFVGGGAEDDDPIVFKVSDPLGVQRIAAADR